MPTYNVSVRATYYDDLQIEADSKEKAYELAVKSFEPTGDNCMSIDVFGLSPWAPENNDEDVAHEQQRQREIDDAA